jgi:pimeloyl-ACP methyl ester carboxylesterase
VHDTGLEIARFGEGRRAVVVLHEGLGSVSTWRGWPERLHARCGAPVVAYSRAGYGRSPPVPLPRPLDYMQREARDLPRVLDAMGVDEAVLVGHSDGASIAIVCAATSPRVLGLALIAPHVFVEDVTVASIAAARREYEHGSLRERLARHHANVDVAFRGWCDAWLDPAFGEWNITEHLPNVRVPVLVVQGDADPYGTLAQVDAIREGVRGPFEAIILAGAAHAPWREREEETTTAVCTLVRRVL